MIMQIDKILPVPKRYLLLANAIVWGVPGVKVFLTGLKSYFLLDTSAPLILNIPILFPSPQRLDSGNIYDGPRHNP